MSRTRIATAGRAAVSTLAALGLAALLSGCVAYPDYGYYAPGYGYGYPGGAYVAVGGWGWGGHDWHGGDWHGDGGWHH